MVGTLGLYDACEKRGIHCTSFATGCIYSYDESHPMGSGKGFTEEDPPNFAGSFYSQTKGYVDQLTGTFPKTLLVLRLRMPISDDLSPRSFVTKICKYRKVVDIPNSMSILHDLLPLALQMANAGLTGRYNFTNPGVISHGEVLALYQRHVDPSFWWEHFTLEEQAKVLKAPRSNNELDASKLKAAADSLGVSLPGIKEAFEACFARMAAYLKERGQLPPPPMKPPKEEMDAAIKDAHASTADEMVRAAQARLEAAEKEKESKSEGDGPAAGGAAGGV